MRSAPRFQLVMTPAGVFALMASSEESTMDARSAVLASVDCVTTFDIRFSPRLGQLYPHISKIEYAEFCRPTAGYLQLRGCLSPDVAPKSNSKTAELRK